MKPEMLLNKRTGLALALAAVLSVPAAAQPNPIKRISSGTALGNVGLDYLSKNNAYLLANDVRPVTISGMPNNTMLTGNPSPRLHLEVIPENFSASIVSKTYCTNFEVNLYLQHECPTLSTAFIAADTRQTANGDFIVCGTAVRNPELGTCNIGPMYWDGFLLRTDANGNPLWYKRYELPGGGSYRFNTVTEDPTTGNFVVGGNGGFIMGTTSSGTPLWQQTITAYWQGGTISGNSVHPELSRVISYAPSGSPQSYCVLTGAISYTDHYPSSHASYGGGMLVTVDPASGAIMNNVQLSQDNQSVARFLQLTSLTDAYDGDVVLTGSVGGQWCFQHDANNTVLLKINPINSAVSFMKMYENSAGVCNTGTCSVVGSSGGSGVVLRGAAQSNICVAGYGDVAGGGLHTGAMYLETDNSGNTIRYVGHDGMTGTGARPIVYNTTNAYPLYTGATTVSTTFAAKHKLAGANTDCDPDAVIIETDLDPDVAMNDATPINMIAISEPITAYPLPDAIRHFCGDPKLREEAPASVAATPQAGALTVAPNPALNYVDVTLPRSLEGGTVRLYDFQGRLVLKQDFSNGSVSVHLNTTSLAPGVYSVGIQDGAKVRHATFVKQ